MADSLNFDVVILGAGPAGAAAAIATQRAGLSVALIDKATFPRDKLCGGLVSGRGQKALAGLIGPLDPALFHPVRAVRFQWGGEVLATFEAPSDQTYTMRFDFDAALFQAACAAGATPFTGQRGAKVTANRVTLADGRALRFRVLIGADGVNSAVARHLFGRAFDPNTIGFALEAEAPLDRFPADPVMMIDFDAAHWGYGWSFPKQASRTIGVGGVQAKNQDLKTRMAELLRLDGVDPDTVRIKGHFIPFGDFRKAPGRDNVMLVGDAAGLVDPLTGEGLAYALESGALAGEVAAEVLSQDRPQEAAHRLTRRYKPFHDELTRAGRLRRYAFASGFRSVFCDRLRKSERMRRVFFQLLDGDVTYGEIERMALKSTFGRLAGKLAGKS